MQERQVVCMVSRGWAVRERQIRASLLACTTQQPAGHTASAQCPAWTGAHTRSCIVWLPACLTPLPPFLPGCAPYLQVWEGAGVVKSARKLIGATNPLESEPGTIRGDFAVQVRRRRWWGGSRLGGGEG